MVAGLGFFAGVGFFGCASWFCPLRFLGLSALGVLLSSGGCSPAVSVTSVGHVKSEDSGQQRVRKERNPQKETSTRNIYIYIEVDIYIYYVNTCRDT